MYIYVYLYLITFIFIKIKSCLRRRGSIDRRRLRLHYNMSRRWAKRRLRPLIRRGRLTDNSFWDIVDFKNILRRSRRQKNEGEEPPVPAIPQRRPSLWSSGHALAPRRQPALFLLLCAQLLWCGLYDMKDI